MPQIASLEERLARYFEAATGASGAPLEWRLTCFEQGLSYAEFIERNVFPLEGKDMLDMAAGWGGHSLAFAAYGCRVEACDLNDFNYSKLNQFASDQGLRYRASLADCQSSPFSDNKFDVILALELIEHIPNPELLAQEVARLLKPGGICILSTPARLGSVYMGEAHYKIKGLAMLPFFMQGFIARNLFGATYPFSITRQYAFSSAVIRPFRRRGLEGTAVLVGNPAKKAGQSGFWKFVLEQMLWKFLVLRKPPLIV